MEIAALTAPAPRDTDEFLAWAELQDGRFELASGRVVALPWISATHGQVQVNLIMAVGRRLRGGPCRINPEGYAVRIDARTARFADATITCGPPERKETTRPVVVFEVLSPKTEATDRGPKRREYGRLPSLRHYVLLAQDAPRAEVLTRTEAGSWLLTEAEGMDAAFRLDPPGIELPLGELYEGVDFALAESAPESGADGTG